MKKYFLGMLAFMIAVASVAFTTAPKKTTYVHIFEGPSDASLSNIALWQYEQPAEPSGCSEQDETACYVVSDKNEAQFKAFLSGKTAFSQLIVSGTSVITRENQ